MVMLTVRMLGAEIGCMTSAGGRKEREKIRERRGRGRERRRPGLERVPFRYGHSLLP